MARNRELRIVAQHENFYARLAWVRVDTRTGDIHFGTYYANVPAQRWAYHASGVRNWHVPPSPPWPPEPYLRADPGPRAGEFTGVEELQTINRPPLEIADWTYRPKAKHTNLIVDATQHFELAVWLVEAGRDDLVRDLLEAHYLVISHALLDGCDPWVLAVAWTLPPEAWASLERAIRQSEATKGSTA